MSKYSNIFLLSNAEYENIGDCLRLRKYGSWLAEEVWTREEQGQKRAQFTLRAIALAKKIAIERDIDQDEAFAMLQSGSGEGSILSEYSEDAMALMSSMPSGRDQFGELVTIFFRNRGEVFSSKKWSPTEDWTIEDTQKLPKAFLDQIEAFMAAEDKGVSAKSDEDQEEEAGKND
jgi:hypothetical protein